MWYGAELEHGELENLFLFWDGSAWSESPHKLPRRLINGVADFMRIENDPTQSSNVHLNQIKEWLNKYEADEIRSNETFLILGGIDQNSSLIILDGNHRISAALWQATRSKDRSQLPQKAWIGLSPDMICYMYYQRILLARWVSIDKLSLRRKPEHG